MTPEQEMVTLKADIAALFARRENLKQALERTTERGARRKLWVELENADARLSQLDTRYKQLWDAQRNKPDNAPGCRKVLVLGIGNVLWADEGFGVRVVEALHREHEFPANVTLMDGGTQGLYLLQHLQAASHVLIFDAVDYGLEPGTLKVARDRDVPQFMGAKKMSLHQVGFQETLLAARLTDQYPDQLTLVGAQPLELEDYGGGLTPTLAARIPSALELGLAELAGWGIAALKRSKTAGALSPLSSAA